MVFSHIISKNICTSLLGLKINMILTISDHLSLTGKIINKLKQLLKMEKAGQPQSKMLSEVSMPSLQLWSTTFFGYPSQQLELQLGISGYAAPVIPVRAGHSREFQDFPNSCTNSMNYAGCLKLGCNVKALFLSIH